MTVLDKFTAYEIARMNMAANVAIALNRLNVEVYMSKTDWRKLLIPLPIYDHAIKQYKLRLDIEKGEAILDTKGNVFSGELTEIYRPIDNVLKWNGIQSAIGPLSERDWNRDDFKPHKFTRFDYKEYFLS